MTERERRKGGRFYWSVLSACSGLSAQLEVAMHLLDQLLLISESGQGGRLSAKVPHGPAEQSKTGPGNDDNRQHREGNQ